jgi:hypothetical protein
MQSNINFFIYRSNFEIDPSQMRNDAMAANNDRALPSRGPYAEDQTCPLREFHEVR